MSEWIRWISPFVCFLLILIALFFFLFLFPSNLSKLTAYVNHYYYLSETVFYITSYIHDFLQNINLPFHWNISWNWLVISIYIHIHTDTHIHTHKCTRTQKRPHAYYYYYFNYYYNQDYWCCCYYNCYYHKL